LLTWLTAPPVEAAAEQHRGRAAQHLDAVEVEGVAVVEGRVAHAVQEDVAGAGQREAAQADVLLAALGRLEGDAAVLRSASFTVSRLRSSISFSVTTVIDCGMSRSSWLPLPIVVVVVRSVSLPWVARPAPAR
jgi:hypothetical protein